MCKQKSAWCALTINYTVVVYVFIELSARHAWKRSTAMSYCMITFFIFTVQKLHMIIMHRCDCMSV